MQQILPRVDAVIPGCIRQHQRASGLPSMPHHYQPIPHAGTQDLRHDGHEQYRIWCHPRFRPDLQHRTPCCIRIALLQGGRAQLPRPRKRAVGDRSCANKMANRIVGLSVSRYGRTIALSSTLTHSRTSHVGKHSGWSSSRNTTRPSTTCPEKKTAQPTPYPDYQTAR
jgi:hypothetical protein